MPHLPFYFDFSFRLRGPRFGAEVRIRGRVTCVEEFGAHWMYGVNPGSLAESGSDVESAWAAFRTGIAEVLCDVATAAPDFLTFRVDAERFVAATNSSCVREWEDAREAVRAGGAADLALRRETREIESAVAVRELLVAAARDADGSFEWLADHTVEPARLAA